MTVPKHKKLPTKNRLGGVIVDLKLYSKERYEKT